MRVQPRRSLGGRRGRLTSSAVRSLAPCRRPAPQAGSRQPQRPVFGSGGGPRRRPRHRDRPARGISSAASTERDFELREDGRPQPITAFSSERVPVSIGIALDLSNSMKGDKLRSAKTALSRLLDETARPGRRDLPLRVRRRAGAAPGVDHATATWFETALDRTRAGGLTALYDARPRGGQPGGDGQAPEEGARHRVGRDRHREPHRRARASAADPRVGRAGVRDRDRRRRLGRAGRSAGRRRPAGRAVGAIRGPGWSAAVLPRRRGPGMPARPARRAAAVRARLAPPPPRAPTVARPALPRTEATWTRWRCAS